MAVRLLHALEDLRHFDWSTALVRLFRESEAKLELFLHGNGHSVQSNCSLSSGPRNLESSRYGGAASFVHFTLYSEKVFSFVRGAKTDLIWLNY